MEEKKRLTLSELKVGVFVIVAAIVLAVAIFTIGSQVGLFEETFLAKTYLNNVSGLKPGDVVLLGGVEVGNVVSVDILSADETPNTQENLRLREEIERLEVEESNALRTWLARREQLEQLRNDYEQALVNKGPDDPEVAGLRERVEDLQRIVDNERDDLDRVRERLERARAGIQNIVLYLRIKEEYRDWIRVDSSISLGSVGLLGDKYIEISLGRSPEKPDPVVETTEGWFGDTTRRVVPITGRTQSGFQELITGANDVLANMETLSGTLQDIMRQFEEGEGSIGKFFADESFYNNLNDVVVRAKDTVDNATSLFRDVREGEGTIPALIQERELYDRLNTSISRMEEILGEVEEGRGTLGKLVNDPAIYESANATMENIRGITARMEAGDGTLGKLSADEKLYEDMRETLNQMSSFVRDIESGKGTLGRLAKDEQLYENLNEVSSEVVKLLYDFRQNPRKFLTIKLELF